MSNLNLSNCGLNGQTGQAPCGLDPALFQYAILVPKGQSIPSASLTTADTVMAYIQTQLQSSSRSTQWFRTPLLTNLEDKTEGVKEEDRDGQKYTVFEPTWNLQYLLTNATICDYKNMLKFSKKQAYYDLMLVDANNVLFGMKKSDGSLRGFSLAELYVYLWKPRTVAKLPVYMIGFKFQYNNEVQNNLGYFDCSSASLQAPELAGLISTNLSQGATTPNTTSALYISAKFGCDSNSVGAYYGSVLNSASAWVVTSSSGVSRTLTGVTYNATLDQFVLASAAAFVNGDLVSLAAPSVLLALSTSVNLITETSFAVVI